MSTLLDRPAAGDSRTLLVLAHGAGAGMEHPFMKGLSGRLRDRGVAVLRWQFPYMEAGSRRPDRPDVATDAVRAAALRGRELAGEGPLFVGGKSFGARMTSTAASRGMLKGADPAGLVHVGFPLHPAGKPGTSRADHLAAVPHPQLFLQGTRDALADLELMGTALEGLGEGATLHVVEGADHGFHVLKRSGRTDDQVLDELADEAAAWMRRLAAAAITGGDG